jgi:hypothetical protein
VAAQRQDPAARATDIVLQQLEHRRGPDVLDTDGVLGPADGVGERGGVIPVGVRCDGLADLQEKVLRDPQTCSTVSRVYRA